MAAGGGRINMGAGKTPRSALAKLGLAVLLCNMTLDTYDTQGCSKKQKTKKKL